jgi:hypothetical protein
VQNPIRRSLAWGKALRSPGRRRRAPAQPVAVCPKATQPARAWQPPRQLQELPHEGMADVITAIGRPYVLTHDEWQQVWLGRRALAGMRGMGDE